MNYGGDYYYASTWNVEETSRRDPGRWLDSVQSPVYVFEGTIDGNWDVIQLMQQVNRNPLIQFYPIDGHDHFSLLHPITNLIAEQLQQGQLQINEATLGGL